MAEYYQVDERTWRGKVRDLAIERDKKHAQLQEAYAEIERLKAECGAVPVSPAAPADDGDVVALKEQNEALRIENKELHNKIKGFRMQLGRQKNKENKG